MALVLTLVAVPLSRLRPRQGRYARVGFAIVVYFVYSNLLSAAKVWIEKGELSPAIGVWWVHIAILALGLYLVFRGGEQHVNTLDRYLYRTVLVYTLMAMGVLLTLGGLYRVHQPAERHRRRQLHRTADAFLFTLLEPAAASVSSCCRSAR